MISLNFRVCFLHLQIFAQIINILKSVFCLVLHFYIELDVAKIPVFRLNTKSFYFI